MFGNHAILMIPTEKGNIWLENTSQEIAFNHWLDKIESLGIKTLNPITTIQKNKHKFYLKKLEKLY